MKSSFFLIVDAVFVGAARQSQSFTTPASSPDASSASSAQ